ncbi:NAD(P)H-dependent oxidoreductase [Actinosynnema sp. NPDC023587]|uniref:NADPH-dependent FMN reductase n=1 Tax=Actinosynnema sp. NPDC023587 TaxID=3154695 RepID=UPI003402C178
MSNTPLKLAVIIGSVRTGRFGPTVASWFTKQAVAHGGVEVDVIDLADYPLPLQLPAFGQPAEPEVEAVRTALGKRIGDAEAYAVITPEYNHAVPASLKNAIDWYLDEWKAKPVGLISYGGMGGGLRAAGHLRQVFAELHATTVRNMISFHNAWGDFDADGTEVSPAGSDQVAKDLIDQLVWWGEALREARAKNPYAF